MIRKNSPSHESEAGTEQPLPDVLKRAPFIRRALALAIDFIVAAALFLGGLVYPLMIMDRKGWVDFPDADITFSFYGNWYSILWLVFYFAVLTWIWKGRTIGKWLCGIRVVSLSGDRIRFMSSLKRAFGFGLFQSIPGKLKINRHDELVGTAVVVDPRWKQKEKLREPAGAVDLNSTDPAVQPERDRATRGKNV